MGLRLFGGYDEHPYIPPRQIVVNNYITPPVANVNPNPNKFRILGAEYTTHYTLLTVEYEGCTNFEGQKVLLLDRKRGEDIMKTKKLDPHFSLEANSPIARFIPTKRGKMMARQLMKFLENSREWA